MKAGFQRCALVAAVALAMSGCNSKKTSKRAEEKSGAEQKPAAAAQSTANIDLNCVVNRLQNPTEAFHYSYKKDSSNPVHEEADITPQTIDGSFTNTSGSSPVHGIRSDANSWQAAWSGLTGISGMASAIALVNHSSATAREGPEKMNGYDATRYSIDTARGDTSEQGLYQSVLGAGGFEKGTVWITTEGCPVKMVVDSELHSKDGSVEKIHYEEAMIRK